MVRKARFNLPAIPQHLIQRGNNRAPIPPHRINAWRFYLTFRLGNRGQITVFANIPTDVRPNERVCGSYD
jgi:hypothetical protein